MLQMYLTVGRVSQVEKSIEDMVFQRIVTNMPADKEVEVCPRSSRSLALAVARV